jgi:hypothetical protein
MLQFSEKHFESRYSGLFAALVRMGIVFRAAASLLGKAARRFSWPLLDFAVVYTCAAAAAVVHSTLLNAEPSPLFFVAVAPFYALGSVAGTAAAGGYGHRRRIRSVWAGVLLGMLFVASASFFVKEIAFSRFVVLATFPLAASIASLLRIMWSRRRDNPVHGRRAVLVGLHGEAARLQQILARHPRPPFRLDGYIGTESGGVVRNGKNGSGRDREPKLLGHEGQLRDIVRLRRIDDVVFASAALSNQAIFRLIQQLKDLPVHFRILAEGRDHVIGKASVDDLSMISLLEAEEALVHRRSPVARRAFEWTLAVLGLIGYPIVAAAATMSGGVSFSALLAAKLRRLTEVIRGTSALIGFDRDGDFIPPDDWDLRPGVFAVSEAIDIVQAGPDEISAAYWFYVRNQSASLDWDIIVRSLRLLRSRL